MRLQVFLSSSGIASRRSAVDIIKSGRVRVNNRLVFEPSHRVIQEKDKVYFDDRRVFPKEKIYIILHKPKRVTTTKKDKFAEKTVMDLLPRRFRYLNPVGRLDKDTTGLLLLTNDGSVINRLTHPKFKVDKIYVVHLNRKLAVSDKLRLEEGVSLDGRRTAGCRVQLGPGKTLKITIHEGRNRQIRRIFAKAGYSVKGLKRLKEGMLTLGSLPEGTWRFLTKEEKLYIALD